MVNKTFLHIQEIETHYIIPSLRRSLALELTKENKQKDIANILGINSAAISQYKSEKRGNKIKFDEETKKEIQKSANKIKDRFSYLKEVQRLLKFIRDKEHSCTFHKLFSNVPTNCNPAEAGCQL